MCKTSTYTRVISPDSIKFVEAHYRSTHMGLTVTQALHQTVVFGEGTRGQLLHEHHVSDLTRFGTGMCHSCGLHMFSPAWVADGVFGEGTSEYLTERIRSWTERVNHDALRFSVPTVVAAMSDEEPAMLTGSVASVPAMKRGVLT